MRASLVPVLLLLALLGAPGPAQAQAQGGVPLSVDPAEQDVESGRTAFVHLAVTNPLDRGLRLNVTASEDWPSSRGPLLVSVSPSDTLLLPRATVVVRLEIPTTSEAFGYHSFRARVATPDEPGLANETAFSLWVTTPTTQPEPMTPPPPMTQPEPQPSPSFGRGPWSFRASLLTPEVTLGRQAASGFVELEVENTGDFARLTMRGEDLGGRLRLQGGGGSGSSVMLSPGSTLRPSYGFAARDPEVGEHLMRVTLSLEEDPSQVQSFDVRVLVREASPSPVIVEPHDVRMRGPSVPVEVAPGGAARVDYVVANRGGTGVFVTLGDAFVQAGEGPAGRPVTGFAARWSGETTFLLAAGESRALQLLLEASAAAPPAERLFLAHRVSVDDGRAASGVAGETPLVVAQAGAPAPPGGVSTASRMADAAREHPVAVAGVGVGLGALGVAALLRREAWRWLALAGALPLYTRLARSDVLDHKARDALHRLILAEPGVHYSALKERTGLQTGALVHHLRTLERHRLVVSRREGSLRCFYPVGPALPPVQVALTTPMQTRVLALLDEGPLTQKELGARLGLGQQGVSYHVKTLERKGLLAVEPGPDGVLRCRRVRDLAVQR